MSRRKTKSQDKHARTKLFAIPVLLCILGCVLWSNVSKKKERNSETLIGATLKDVGVDRKLGSDSQTELWWPEVSTDFLEGPNPLASYRVLKPTGLPVAKFDPLPTTQQETKDSVAVIKQELGRLPLQYMFHSERRKVVMLGGRMLEAGDTLSDRVTVHGIDKGSLVLKVERSNDGKSKDAVD